MSPATLKLLLDTVSVPAALLLGQEWLVQRDRQDLREPTVLMEHKDQQELVVQMVLQVQQDHRAQLAQELKISLMFPKVILQVAATLQTLYITKLRVDTDTAGLVVIRRVWL
jgi:hypothetical protein